MSAREDLAEVIRDGVGTWRTPLEAADAILAVLAPQQAALDAVLALADKWRYKGEHGWGAWQEGHGPDPEGAVLDAASFDIRAAVNDALEADK